MAHSRMTPIWLATVPAALAGVVLVAGAGRVAGAEPLLAAPAVESVREAATAIVAWIGDSYARAPALVLGLAVLAAAPLVALAGAMMRAAPLDRERTRLVRGGRGMGEDASIATRGGERAAPSREGWLEVDGQPGRRIKVGRGMVRVGREDDNDIRLEARTVHRYHAVIHRNGDGEHVVTDLSGGGNGVLLNGRRIVEARLSDGDIISIGGESLRFGLAR
ncbi:MAG: FHA domain-containing protein [Pseudomonadota bacterium]